MKINAEDKKGMKIWYLASGGAFVGRSGDAEGQLTMVVKTALEPPLAPDV